MKVRTWVHFICDECGKEGWIREPRYGCDILPDIQAWHMHSDIRIGARVTETVDDDADDKATEPAS